MDNSFDRQGSHTQGPRNPLVTSLQIVGDFLHWLTGLFQLTEEEKEDAGIHIGYQCDE